MKQAPSDAPFGLAPNVAAGLAYLLGILGGVVMLAGGGTNKTVKWAAAQSIVMWVIYFALAFIIPTVAIATHLTMIGFLSAIVNILWLLAWIWTSATAFRGIELRVPVISGVAAAIFRL